MSRACDENSAPTYFFYNLGCPKNLVDAEKAAGRLEAAGWRRCLDPRDADLLVVTTCAFIAAAEEESVEQILEVAAARDSRQLLAVVGCLVSREGDRLGELLPEVDIFLDVGTMDRLPEAAGGRQAVPVAAPAANRALFTPPHIAYLKIADGCSNHCSYCRIPSIRGPLASRPPDDLIFETRSLAAAGVPCFVIGSFVNSAPGRILVANFPDRSAHHTIRPQIPAPNLQSHSAMRKSPASDSHQPGCCADIFAAKPDAPPSVPETQKAFATLMRSVQAPGALSDKAKELILFSLVVYSRCHPCFDAHLQKARELGLTQTELDDFEKLLRTLANDVYCRVNEQGHI